MITQLRHILLCSTVFFAACGGGSGGSSTPPSGGSSVSPPPPPPPIASAQTKLDNMAEAARFISIAGFGEDADDLNALVNQNAEDWLAAQLALVHTSYLTETNSLIEFLGDNPARFRAHLIVFWKRAVEANDPLRHRMVYALSQIVVASDRSVESTKAMAYYMDVLAENAFGNYKDVLTDITYAPAMADYLTYLYNEKANEETGRMPDENYAREILQLFSIGVNELNIDGTLKLDAMGDPIPTFDNSDIGGLARVFTGLVLDTESSDDWETWFTTPLITSQWIHSEKEKAFLGSTIPENTPAAESIEQAIDIIFNHPNVAPFISRQLIQRFTASNPEPAYVQRVAEAFESGTFTGPDGTQFGSTGRGDLSATLAAILLDESQFDASFEIEGSGDLTDIGKIREPVLNFAHWARAFDVSPVSTVLEGSLFWETDKTLGQSSFGSLSVFNFYRPGFIPGGTQAGAQGLTVPEMQLVNAASRNSYIDFMTNYVMDQTYIFEGDPETVSFKPDYDTLIESAEDIPAMIDHLDMLLTYGRMSQATKQNITDLLAEVTIRTSTPERTADDKLLRAELAVLLVVTSPEYMVQQ